MDYASSESYAASSSFSVVFAAVQRGAAVKNRLICSAPNGAEAETDIFSTQVDFGRVRG